MKKITFNKSRILFLLSTLTAILLLSGCDFIESEISPVDITPVASPIANYDAAEYTHDEDEELYYYVVAVYYPQTLTQATVTRVIDGDTLELSTGERVRLIGIDAPEVNTPGADEATAFVREHTLNQTVWLESDGNDTDVHNRLRRYVWLALPIDPTDAAQIQRYQLNALLLMNGLAEVMIIGNVRNADLFHAIAVPLATPPETTVQETAEYSFIGNKNSLVFHLPTCRSLPAEHNRIYFQTRDEAVDAGHRPCGICSP